MKVLFSILVITCAYSCDVKNEDSQLTTLEIYNELNRIYSSNDTIELSHYFEQWNKSIEPNSKEFINENDTIKAIYEVYEEFFNSKNTPNINELSKNHIIDSTYHYIVIQNLIYYSILPDKNLDEFHWDKHDVDTILNFKPRLEFDNNRILYLTENYQLSLFAFLGLPNVPLNDSIKSEKLSRVESNIRFDFLNKHFKFAPGHWGGWWHLETHPKISTIVFDPSFTKAKVYFRYWYSGGESVLEKQNNKWIIQETKSTWIE